MPFSGISKQETPCSVKGPIRRWSKWLHFCPMPWGHCHFPLYWPSWALPCRGTGTAPVYKTQGDKQKKKIRYLLIATHWRSCTVHVQSMPSSTPEQTRNRWFGTFVYYGYKSLLAESSLPLNQFVAHLVDLISTFKYYL